MDGLSIEGLVAIISGVFLVVGALITGLTSFLTNFHNNKREDKRFEQRIEHEKVQQKSEERKFEQQLEHENRQQLRVYKMNQLHKILMPIIEIYEKDDRLLNDLEETGAVEVIGTGIQQDQLKEIESIIKANKVYVSIDLMKGYSKVKADYEYIMMHDHMSSNIFHLEQKGVEVAPFLVDEDKEFLEMVEQEARKTEDKYT